MNITTDNLIANGLDAGSAAIWIEALAKRPQQESPEDLWLYLRRNLLTAHHPFTLHRFLYEHVFSEWDETQGPIPAWTPESRDLEASNLARLIKEWGFGSYDDFFRWSVTERTDFWRSMTEEAGIRFRRVPEKVVDLSAGVDSPRWFPGASLNIAESCFQAEPDRPAIIFQDPDAAEPTIWTYEDLETLTNRVANGLQAAGFQKGDALGIDMIMTAESVAIYLGVVKAGCAVVSIADSFSPAEIATRLRIGKAKAVFTQDYIHRSGKKLPMYQKVVEAGAGRIIVLPGKAELAITPREQDLTWDAFLSDDTEFEAVACDPHDTMNVLFSSGTTGDPKAIPWNHATPVKCAVDGMLHQDIQNGDVIAWPTNLGWMMGPWLIYASLINRATIALYYGPPNTAGFCDLVREARVNMLGVVPSLVKAWLSLEPAPNWPDIKCFSSTGECSNAEDMLFLMSRAGYRPVIEYCGGTEIGGGYITGSLVQPASPATFSTPALGLDLLLLDEEGKPTDTGEVFLIPPSMGLSVNLLNKDHHSVYYKNAPHGPNDEILRRHGDRMARMYGGYYRAQGRADDTMNLGGIKVGSAEIERTLKNVADVMETAAIAVNPKGGGPSLLVIYAVIEGSPDSEDLKGRMQQAIKSDLNPLFKIHDVRIRESLPRTASGKVMRRELRAEYNE